MFKTFKLVKVKTCASVQVLPLLHSDPLRILEKKKEKEFVKIVLMLRVPGVVNPAGKLKGLTIKLH